MLNNKDAIDATEAGLPINPALLTLLNEGFTIKTSLFLMKKIGLFKSSALVNSILYTSLLPFSSLISVISFLLPSIVKSPA